MQTIGPTYDQTQVVDRKVNYLALVSLALGIIGAFYTLSAVAAIICGHLALAKLSAVGRVESGRNYAIAGLILGYVGVGITVLTLTVGLVFATVISRSLTGS
jgi:hypothetical protein